MKLLKYSILGAVALLFLFFYHVNLRGATLLASLLNTSKTLSEHIPNDDTKGLFIIFDGIYQKLGENKRFFNASNLQDFIFPIPKKVKISSYLVPISKFTTDIYQNNYNGQSYRLVIPFIHPDLIFVGDVEQVSSISHDLLASISPLHPNPKILPTTPLLIPFQTKNHRTIRKLVSDKSLIRILENCDEVLFVPISTFQLTHSSPHLPYQSSISLHPSLSSDDRSMINIQFSSTSHLDYSLLSLSQLFQEGGCLMLMEEIKRNDQFNQPLFQILDYPDYSYRGLMGFHFYSF